MHPRSSELAVPASKRRTSPKAPLTIGHTKLQEVNVTQLFQNTAHATHTDQEDIQLGMFLFLGKQTPTLITFFTIQRCLGLASR